MIAALTGRLAYKTPSLITLDVQGVGYQVFIPLSTYYSLPDVNQGTSVHVHTHVREDAIQLFGFVTAEEKEAFVLLTAVSGIGPKLGLSVLSALSLPDLISAIKSGDIDKLATVPGIGQKTAGRLALELKDKIDRVQVRSGGIAEQVVGLADPIQADAVSALVNLGYKPAEVKDVLKRMTQPNAQALPLKDLIRGALKELARG